MSRQLDPADVEAIAQRVVEILGDAPSSGQLVSAAELSRRLGLSRSTVYEKADEFGAIRIGNGPRARLRFDARAIEERLAVTRPAPSPRASPGRRVRRSRGRRRPDEAGLLPIRGEVPQ
jgi:hypothetical protein